MVDRTATLIFNPKAGFWDWDDAVVAFSDYWKQKGWQVTVVPTAYASHATDLARRAAEEGRELVFAAGGDGTLHEVANGLAHSRTIMAPLPVGTANSLARELGMPMPSRFRKDWFLGTMQVLSEGRVRNMDLGRCEDGRYWLLWASAGLDGYVINRIEPRSPRFKRLGTPGYALRALTLFPHFRGAQSEVIVDGRHVAGDMLMVLISNCRLYGGGRLWLNRQGILDDGLFEVWIFHGRHWLSALRYVLAIGLDRHRQEPGVEFLQGRTVSVASARPWPYHLDAEPAGLAPFSCSVQPQALRLLTPKYLSHKLFSGQGEALGHG